MQFPSFAEYTEALQLDLSVVLSDPLLGRGTLRTRGPGLPLARSGNFALTYEVFADGRKYALRCFHKPADALDARYDAIGRHLARVGSPHFVGFQFQPAGITTESGSYPVVRMEWAEGPNLAGFVADHRHDVNALQQLRVSLRRLARHLRDNGIAHGDMQPTNLIVRDATHLTLIDYDGMFVPELGPLHSAELGQRNFQHPGRRSWHFDESLDAFSFAVIDLALDALCKRPDLWDLTSSGEDAFILRAADFADPANSPLFSLLGRVPGLEQRTRHLAAVCVSPFDRIPSFEDFLAGRDIPEVAVRLSGNASLALRRPYVSAYRIVDAADFARCCAHVGDRVEMIGRILHVAKSHPSRDASTYVRVEFGEHEHDMACLKIWPGAEPALPEVPDDSWVGQWVSATGLIEPVYSGHSGAQRQKDVSISITTPSQLRRLTPEEAQYRLHGHTGRAGPALNTTGGIRTDPVLTDAAPRLPRGRVSPTRRAHGGTRHGPRRTAGGAAPLRTAATQPTAATDAAEVWIEEPAAAAARISGFPIEERFDALPDAEVEALLEPEPAPVAASASPVAPVLDSTPSPVRVEPEAIALPVPVRPVLTGSTLPATRAESGQSAVTQARRAGTVRGRGGGARRWLIMGLAASLAVYAYVSLRPTWNADRRASSARQESVAPAALDGTSSASRDALPGALRAGTAGGIATLQSQGPLRSSHLPIATVAGPLNVVAAADDGRRRVITLDGAALPELRDDEISLAHRAVFPDREVLVGFTACRGQVPPCGVRRPFWLVARPGAPPAVLQVPGLWASSDAGSVSAANEGVRVDLGVWNGERRLATLTAAGEIEVSRTREAVRALNRTGCRTAITALEACAAGRDCRSFQGASRSVPRAQRDALTRMYHESTGFDAVAFRGGCVRACQLGVTPSEAFIRRTVCSGARPDQWTSGDPATGLFD